MSITETDTKNGVNKRRILLNLNMKGGNKMYKEYLLQTKTETSWFSTEEELMKAKNKVEPWDVVFCGKVKVEMVYNSDQDKLLYV